MARVMKTKTKPRRNRWVTDTFSARDVGQMMLSVFAIVAVFASKTILPVNGLVLTIATIVILFVATMLFLTKLSYKKSFVPALKHIGFGVIVAFILTFFIGIIFGHRLWDIINLYDLWFNTEVAVAFCHGLFWSVVLDSLKD